MNLAWTVSLTVASSLRFKGSEFRLRDYFQLLFCTLFATANLVRSMHQLFERANCGFFYENKRRGISLVMVSLVQLPDFNQMKTVMGANIWGIVSLVMSVVVAALGFCVTDVEHIPLHETPTEQRRPGPKERAM